MLWEDLSSRTHHEEKGLPNTQWTEWTLLRDKYAADGNNLQIACFPEDKHPSFSIHSLLASYSFSTWVLVLHVSLALLMLLCGFFESMRETIQNRDSFWSTRNIVEPCSFHLRNAPKYHDQTNKSTLCFILLFQFGNIRCKPNTSGLSSRFWTQTHHGFVFLCLVQMP